MRPTIFLLPVAWACGMPDATSPIVAPSETGPKVADTGFPPGEYASMHIDFGNGSQPPRLSAVFVESSPGFVNLAQCVSNDDVPCLPQLPNVEDDFVNVPTNLDVDRDLTTTRFQGRSVHFADYELPYREDGDSGFGHYGTQLTLDDPTPFGWVGTAWEGQWQAGSIDRLLFVSDPMTLVAPSAGAHIEFHNGQFFPFEWVPTGEGIVTLNVSNSAGFSRMYLLEDDGYFELDADSLGFASLTEDLNLTFMRWHQGTMRMFGHRIDATATSHQSLTAEYFNIGPREYFAPADGCAEAAGMPPLQTGGYWGDLKSYFANMNPLQCLAGGCAFGKDGLYRVVLPPRNLLSVDYTAHSDSGSIYLMEPCGEANCRRGADWDPNANASEFLNYFNDSNDDIQLYLGVDSSGNDCNNPEITGTRFTLDVDIQLLAEPPMVDTCEDAQDAILTPPGNYYASITAFEPDLNPGEGQCTMSSVNGADAVTPILVPPGATLSVTINMPGGDPAIYLLYCDAALTCPVGSDLSLGTQEQLQYINQGTVEERVYLVVDSKTALLPYFLNISLF